MFNKILKSFLGLFLVLVFAGSVSAVTNSTSIRLQSPVSQTNQDTFNLIFVVLDTDSSKVVTVQCYKNGPSDGGVFTAFGSPITLSAGGNTDVCQINSGVINEGSGTYRFYVRGTGGSTSPVSTESSPVSVDFNTGGPGTPTDFSKSKNNPCEYKVSYKSADDAGKTVKVELYRSDNQTFSADSGTRVGSHTIGSNTSDSFINGIPDCNKDYYYVVRAFDTYGNGSGLAGDSSVTVTTGSTTTSVTTTPGAGGAILVGQGQGQVLGEETQESASPSSEKGKEGEVKGEETKETTPTPKPAEKILSTKNIIFGLIALAVASLAFYIYKKSKKV